MGSNCYERENKGRKEHTYKVGDKVLLTKPGKNPKMSVPRTGPYIVTKVSTNGTVRIQKGILNQCVNIRCIVPYFE